MANRKYLDASGLNYLWQKIKYGFASVGASGFETNGSVLLADGKKGITGSAYTLGTGTMGSGATVLATEAGVSGAINSAISGLPITGVTGNILSVVDKKVQATLSLNYDSASTKLQILGKDGSTVVSEIDATAFIKDGMLDYAKLHVRTNGTWSPALPDDVTEPSGTVDGTYIVLKWNTVANKSATFINVTSLIDTYTADGQGLELNNDNHQFYLELDSTGNVTLSKSANGLKANVAVWAPSSVPSPDFGETAYIGYVAGTTFAIQLPAEQSIDGKIDKVPSATVGNLAEFVSGGGLQDSGAKVSDFLKKEDVSIPASVPDAAFGQTVTVATIGSTGVKFTMPSETHEPMDETEFNSGISGAEYLMSQAGYAGPTWPAA